MSVLNQSGEEQVECPLCMEPLEVDDLNFYPCTCGYQICRFCWHRIRVDENGLCPACRKAYSENPADFTPLSQQQVLQLKAEKKARDQQRKAKLSESRKHLAAVRVVQKNLVFVVGLPVRLADADVLKRNEYFGKFGKIHKVVINQSTSYAGSQGPSASAYVTYVKSDDALRAIQSVNNITLDGRLIKSSLGTTKYCSHFMKNQQCPKADCMYLHDLGDPEASFTKEQMHVGKHQEYEKKLHDSLQARQLQSGPSRAEGPAPSAGDKEGPREQHSTKQDKKTWPTLSGDNTTGFPNKEKPPAPTKSSKKAPKSKSTVSNGAPTSTTPPQGPKEQPTPRVKPQCESPPSTPSPTTVSPAPGPAPAPLTPNNTSSTPLPLPLPLPLTNNAADALENLHKLQILDDNSSFFSNNTFQKCLPDIGETAPPEAPRHILNDSLPDISSSEDWQAAFGFKNDRAPPPNASHGHNLDQQMSKFFAEFNKNHHNGQMLVNYNDLMYNSPKQHSAFAPSPGPHNSQYLNQNGQQHNYQPNTNTADYLNGYSSAYQHQHNNSVFQNQQMPQQRSLQGLRERSSVDDELGFDPFHETQKALAELIESEQNIQQIQNNSVLGTNSNVSGSSERGPTNAGPPNGVLGAPAGHLAPPPGFVQHNTHMNSFGSKILPFLNMSNNQHVGNSSGWAANGYNEAQIKGLAPVSDWMTLDPAIVSSSRHFPLSHFPLFHPNHSHPHSAPLGPQPHHNTHQSAFNNSPGYAAPQMYSVPNGATSHTPNLQSLGGNLQNLQNLGWFSDFQVVNSPPGFRNKGQEC